ncbi:acyltransferase family protein [Tundrisphaera lichenicola]|uniref:acyltransferase family protein n=1 Tax=Tundrisphaera lichenicola TaxID=2029860 RepID=UPI003EBC9A40
MKRIPELDALRGLAAVTIVAYHLWFLKYGFLGTAVDLFFVMSGYLITSIILDQLDRPGFLTTFYARRGLRILPIYYLSLLAFTGIYYLAEGGARLEALPYFLTYTQFVPNYWFAENPPFAPGFNHTWSLAVEEQYYLIWPPALMLFGRRRVVPIGLALIVAAVLSRAIGFSPWILLTRSDGLALGGLLAVLMARIESGQVSDRAVEKILVGIGIVSVAYLAGGGRAYAMLERAWPGFASQNLAQSFRMLAINTMYLSLIGLVVLHSGRGLLAPLRDHRLVGLGQLSYGIYLYHCMVFAGVEGLASRLGTPEGWIVDAIKLLASFGLAMASWNLIERPLLSLKGKFKYSDRTTSVSLRPVDSRSLDGWGTATP